MDPTEQALYARAGRGGLIHHSDRGSQYLSICYTERLQEAGIDRSVGSTGDSYDNALAESIIGLFKTEVIHRRGPWRNLDEVEYATLEWVDWFNNRRLLESIKRGAGLVYCILLFSPVPSLPAMAWLLRIEFEGALYHVMARGNARADIFLDDEDHQGIRPGPGGAVARVQCRSARPPRLGR